jgi:hypothetical protein
MHQDADGNWVADLDPAPAAAPAQNVAPDPSIPPPPPAAEGAPADPTAAGFALPSGAASTAPPTAPPRRSRRGVTGVLTIVGIAVVVLLVKVLIFSGAARVISIATTKTYHEPTSISGDAQSTDSSVVATVNQLKNGIQLPALQGGHTEGAGYTDAQGDLEYLFVLAQDNANSDSARPGVNMASLFGGVEGTEVSPSVTSNFSGISLECATVTDVSGTSNVPLNACDWYNADAFGLFVDYKSSSLSATQQLETSLLTSMTK